MRVTSRILLCTILLMSRLSIYSMSPAHLKDTYTIFTPPYQHLSPLHGSLLLESGVIRNYYDASAHIAVPPHQWLPDIDGPIRLVRALFTDTLGNFDVSHNPNYPARHLGISTIGNIITSLEVDAQHLDSRILEDFTIRDYEFAQSVAAINCERETTKSQYEKLIKSSQSSPQQGTIPHLNYSYNFAINKLKMQRLYQDWTRQQHIAQINARIAEIDQLAGKEKSRAQKERTKLERQLESLQSAQGGSDYNRVRELAQAIIDAHTPSSYYPEHIAEWILLACMCRKAKTKQDLDPYISILRQKLGSQVCAPVDDAWKMSVYAPSDCQTIKELVIPLLQPELADFLEPVTYENIAYAQIIERYYKGPCPKISEYDDIVIHGVSFPDCVEVTLFNFCNMVLFDRQGGTFDIGRIPQGQCAQALSDFYADPTNQQAINIGNPSVHQAWGEILQDWPFITYRQQIVSTADGSSIVISAPKDTNGFIYGLPDHLLNTLKCNEDRVLIAGRWYIHQKEQHGYLCEMHPTIRNFIIVLNHLFNLNIFTDMPIESAFLNDRFNAVYFPRLCEHFALLRSKQWTEQILTSLDKDEYTEKGIHLTFANFDLLLTNDHAEIIKNIHGDTLADLGPTLLKLSSESGDRQRQWTMAQLASIFPVEVAQLPKTNTYPYLIYLPLYNNQIKINAAVYCIQKMSDTTLSESEHTHFIDRAISLMRQLPARLDWQYHIELIDKLAPHELQYPVIQEEIARIIAIANDRLKGEAADCEYVPSLYTALIAKSQPHGDVMTVLDTLLARSDEFDRKPLLNLLITLAKQCAALPQARKAVEICLSNSIESERMLAQTLNEIINK